MKKIGILLGIAILVIGSLQAQSINSEKSVVNFTIKGMFGVEVKGTFAGMQGDVSFDPNDLSAASFNVSIDPSTVFTDNSKRDKHIKNEDFFEVETYQTIQFVSSTVSKTDAGYQTKGELSMHGHTQPLIINFTYSDKTLRGIIEVNRFDYKVGESTKTNKVAEVAQVEIVCVLN